MIVYVENPKESVKLLKLINEFSEIKGYKVNIFKNLFYFYTLGINMWVPKLKNKVLFRISKETPEFKYLGGNTNQCVIYLCTEIFKMPMKEIKDYINKWKDILCS